MKPINMQISCRRVTCRVPDSRRRQFKLVLTTDVICCRSDFASVLTRLHASSRDLPALTHTAKVEKAALDVNCSPLPQPLQQHTDNYTVCSSSVALLQHCEPGVLDQYYPVAVAGDGNCLYRSVALALYGTQDRYMELRARTAIEIALHRAWYDRDDAQFCAPFTDDPRIVCPSYGDLCVAVTKPGEYADVMHILALSAVIGLPIQSYYPPLASCFSTQPLTTVILGRGVNGRKKPKVYLMWTHCGLVPSEGPVEINHFVPLLCGNVGAVHAVNVIDCTEQDDADRPGSGGAGDHVAVVADDSSDDDEDGHPSKVRQSATYDVAAATDDDDAQCQPRQSQPTARFRMNEEVYRLLSTVQNTDIVQEVPRGPKENCHFFVANDVNVDRRRNNRSSRFWDDCGAWDRKQGRNVTNVFVKSPQVGQSASLTSVKLHEGKYCTKKRVDKHITWQPLSPQPAHTDVVTIHAYYATLKADSGYRKRVSWLETESHVAMIEYVGTPPTGNQPHGLARVNCTEYVRTKPKLMDKMRNALEHRQQPRQVYETNVLNAQSFEVPRDHKQVRNLASSVKASEEGPNGKGVGIKNLADDIQSIVQGLQNQSFVQSVILNNGKMPVAIAYTQDQVTDMKRFCARETPVSLRSVVGIDRTFNLGPCFVTTLVYKNMAIVRKATNEHPIFLGPTLFHFDGKTETYLSFFCHLLSVLDANGVHTELLDEANVIFGSDEEKAIVNVTVFYLHYFSGYNNFISFH